MPEGQKAGPKGRQLEVGAQRAPRLLVIYIIENYINQVIASIVSVKDNVEACWEHQPVITNCMHTIIIMKQI